MAIILAVRLQSAPNAMGFVVSGGTNGMFFPVEKKEAIRMTDLNHKRPGEIHFAQAFFINFSPGEVFVD